MQLIGNFKCPALSYKRVIKSVPLDKSATFIDTYIIMKAGKGRTIGKTLRTASYTSSGKGLFNMLSFTALLLLNGKG